MSSSGSFLYNKVFFWKQGLKFKVAFLPDAKANCANIICKKLNYFAASAPRCESRNTKRERIKHAQAARKGNIPFMAFNNNSFRTVEEMRTPVTLWASQPSSAKV